MWPQLLMQLTAGGQEERVLTSRATDGRKLKVTGKGDMRAGGGALSRERGERKHQETWFFFYF